jgi:hypothetical protein
MTDMSVTLTTSGGKVFVAFSTSISHTNNNKSSDCGLFIDADASPRFAVRMNPNDNQDIIPVNLTYLVTNPNLSAGSHTFKIKWQINGNTASQSAATWGAGRTLTVIDLGS